MRTLVIFKGAQGSGKTTFIEKHGLKPYAISPDELRIMWDAPVMSLQGKTLVSTKVENQVWSTLNHMLENRMRVGSFIVLDYFGTDKDYQNLKKLAEKYRYRVICVDLSDVSLEELLRRNESRPEIDYIPVESIKKYYNKVKELHVPKWVTVVKPDEFDDAIQFKPVDFSRYKKIHHIGDVHGSYMVLMKYLGNGGVLKDDELYIFCGDYLDRGAENAEVLNYLLKIYKQKNVLLLTGNHEKWLRKWAFEEGGYERSREFTNNTVPVLEEAEFDKSEVRQLCRKFIQCAYYIYDDKEVLVTHGGLSTIPKNLMFVSTVQMIEGVGDYEDSLICDDNFDRTTASNVYQIHGHRNIGKASIQPTERCFNLEASVEFGGDLRCVQLTHESGFVPISTKNTVYRKTPGMTPLEGLTNLEVINVLKESRFVEEKMMYPWLASFNFTRDAFDEGKWDNCTLKARGLFMDTVNGEIVARSYDKFFNIDETPAVTKKALQRSMVFPAAAYLKENGFLALVSAYEKAPDNKLVVASKSSTKSVFSTYAKKLLYSLYSEETVNKIIFYCLEHKCTFVFECIDVENDPHIIEYKQSELILLDIVDNTLQTNKLPYEELVQVAGELGLKVKRKIATLNNWDEFTDFLTKVSKEDYLLDGQHVEGFVFEDKLGVMLKYKLHYYKLWKFLRSAAAYYKKAGFIPSRFKINKTANEFCDWLESAYPTGMRTYSADKIIQLRNEFFRYKE